jgi:predicted ATPase/DNA-binding CsgD family transcriptional regulator
MTGMLPADPSALVGRVADGVAPAASRESALITATGPSVVPADIAPFIGRDTELDRACELLSHVRLLTLTGPGGVGKTRLALRIAERLHRRGHDDAWLVDLGTLHDARGCTPERLYAHLALAMGIRTHGPAGPAVVLDHLRAQRPLLVLDNCEHLIPAIRACATALLRAAPHLRVLVTSRQMLGADGEYTLGVPPLALPDALTLFRARATAAGVDIGAWADDGLLVELCRRLDGLPLAIGLAAGRVRTLAARQLLHLLDDRFRLLTDAGACPHGAGDPRHSTMERVVQWTYELCTEEEQRLWARASVFARAFDLAAIEAVCGGDGINPSRIVDLVAGLVNKSVFSVDHTTSPARYSLLDTLRDYGHRELAYAGETQLIRDAHRHYFRAEVSHAAAAWFGPTELDAMAAVHQNLPDVLAAVDECITQRDLSSARMICRDLVRLRTPFFWGFLDVVWQLLLRVMSDTDEPTSAAEAVDLSATAATAAWVALCQGHHDTAKQLVANAHDLHRRFHIGSTAPALFAEGGSEALGAGDARAIGLLAAARAAFDGPDATGDQHMATMLWAMATAFVGEPEAAVAASEEYLGQAVTAKAPWATSWALWVAALAALRNGLHQRAADYIGRALRLQRDMDDHWGQTWSIELCAWIIAAQLQHAADARADAGRAAWLLGAACARQDRLGVTLAGLRPFAAGRARALDQITAVQDEVATATAMAAGERQYAKALRIALAEPTPRRATASGSAGLTNREREVAALVAEGLTNAEIAVQLYIAVRTAEQHIRNIMHKLGVHRRTVIATWLVAHSGPAQP